MGELREAFDTSVKESALVKDDLDAGLVQAGRSIADQIDHAIATSSGQDLTKALYLTPHLVNILKEMLATPAARKAAGVAKEAAGGKLGKLQSVPKPKSA